MSIISMKQELQDVRAELKAAAEKGTAMARSKTTSLQDIKAQSDIIDGLQIREKILAEDIERMENGSKPKGKATPKSAFNGMGEFLNAVKKASAEGVVDRRLGDMRNAATGANETTPADGGYLVPPEYADGILDVVESKSILYPQARKVSISGNRLMETYLSETTRADAGRHGGIMPYWLGEADQYNAVKASLAQRQTDVHKLTAYCPVTEEMLEDYPAIESYLNTKVGEAFAWKADDSILSGTGNRQPLGILNANNAALVTIVPSSATGMTLADIVAMYDAFIAQQRKNARWYVSQDAETDIMQMMIDQMAAGTDDISRIISFLPVGAYGNPTATMAGLPVQPIEQCSGRNSLGDIILMDASQYLIVERTGVVKQVSMHVRFDYDESVFKFSWRLGGRPDWMNKITAYNSTTQRSPYVALGARGAAEEPDTPDPNDET